MKVWGKPKTSELPEGGLVVQALERGLLPGLESEGWRLAA